MTIRPGYLRAFSDNYIWILENEQNKSLACVDPGEAAPVINHLHHHKLSLEAILLTHHHYDHVNGVHELLSLYPDTIVYGPKDSRISVETLNIPEGKTFPLQQYHFEMINIPGHTSTHICFYERNFKMLFCGDTLFSAGCGRVFDGSLQLLHDSLQKLEKLPGDTQIFCGHEYTRKNLRFAALVEPDNTNIRNYSQQLAASEHECSLPSTMALEKQINPFLRLNQQAVIQYAKHKGCRSSDSLSVFTQLRNDKDVFKG